SGPKVGNAQTIYESEMAFFHECTQWCARIVLDSADIVRDGDIATVSNSPQKLQCSDTPYLFYVGQPRNLGREWPATTLNPATALQLGNRHLD
ncbi:MAG: hypothetical protein WCF26_01530, partial [Candidatus Sulfotelmatobacter sp.]